HAADTVDADSDGDNAVVGVVYNMVPFAPIDPTEPLDQQAAENVFYLWNLLFLNAVVDGMRDEDADGTGEFDASLAGRMDYIGLNYYSQARVSGLDVPVLPALSELTTFNPITLEPIVEYPRGIYEMAMLVEERWDLPIIVTENGALAAE